MRKIHMTLQFFETSGHHGDLIEKTNPFLDKVNGSMCAKFQVCIVFRLTHKYINECTNTQIHKYTSEFNNILDRLLASRRF